MPYFPGKPPPTTTDDGTALGFYLEDELSRLAASLLDDVQAVEVRPAHAAPLRPRAGMMVYADGTDWNPGFGEGLYSYTIAGTWVKLTKTADAATTNEGIELGSTTLASTPYIDFHSSGNANDYDSRIIASGGTTLGTGTLTIKNSLVAIDGNLTFGGTAWTSFATVVSSLTGAFTTASATMSYKQLGKTLLIRGSITITTVGTGNFPVISLPMTIVNGGGFAREVAAVGFSLSTTIPTTTSVGFVKYDGSAPAASGHVYTYVAIFEVA